MSSIDLDWRRRIVELAHVKQRLADVDKRGLCPHHLPAVAATEAQLLTVEARIGEPLAPSLRDFLTTAGGWRGFHQATDLFGPDDFLGSARWERAVELLGMLEPEVLSGSGVSPDQLLPIAVSADDIDLFVVGRMDTSFAGVVIWFAGSEVERWFDFSSYFATMVDYNRGLIEKVQQHN